MDRKRGRLLAAAAMWVSAATSISAQALNPPYLKEMPSVERVMKEEQANDPKETALLQMQALWELEEIVKQLSGPREVGRGVNGYTPSESQLIVMYETALRQLVKQSDEKFPGPYGGWKRLSLNMKIYPRNDARFGVDGTRLFERFFSASFRAGYEKAVGADAAQHEAFLREQ